MIEEIFAQIDDFCKQNLPRIQKRCLSNKSNDRPGRKPHLSAAEIITISVNYHMSGFKNFKAYYRSLIDGQATKTMFNYVSYNRFTELRSNFITETNIFLLNYMSNKCTGISFVDSTALKVCHEKRNKWHSLFKGSAQLSKTCMGWFYGYKLHLVINHRGEIISFVLSEARASDINRNVIGTLVKNIHGKLFGDRGYISQVLRKELALKGISLITFLKKGMKPKLLHLQDRILLRKRVIIEGVFNILKHKIELEHTRYRSRESFISNVLYALMAYTFQPNKPSITNLKQLHYA